MDSHVKGKDIFIEQLLLDHTIENGKPGICHLWICETYNGIIVIVQHMLFNDKSYRLISNVNSSFSFAQSEIILGKEPSQFT